MIVIVTLLLIAGFTCFLYIIADVSILAIKDKDYSTPAIGFCLSLILLVLFHEGIKIILSKFPF